jgi:hypothetical protein
MVIDYRLGVCEEEMPQDLCVEHVTDLSILVAVSMIATGVAAYVSRALYKQRQAKKVEANQVDLDAPVSELDKKMLRNSIIQARANVQYLLGLCGENQGLVDGVNDLIQSLDNLDEKFLILLSAEGSTMPRIIKKRDYQEITAEVERVNKTVDNYIMIQNRLSNPGSIVSEPHQN